MPLCHADRPSFIIVERGRDWVPCLDRYWMSCRMALNSAQLCSLVQCNVQCNGLLISARYVRFLGSTHSAAYKWFPALRSAPSSCSSLPLLISVPHSHSSFLFPTPPPRFCPSLPLLISVPHSHSSFLFPTPTPLVHSYSPRFCSPLPLLISAFRFLPLSSAFHKCCPYLPRLPASRRYSSLAARVQRNPAYAVPCHSYNTFPPIPASRRHGSFATRVQHTAAPVVLRQRATFLMPEAPGVGRRGGRVGGGALAARAGRGRYHDTSHPRTTLHPSRGFARYRSTPHALAARAGGGAASTLTPATLLISRSPLARFLALPSPPLSPPELVRSCQCPGQPPSPLAAPSPDLAPPSPPALSRQ
eukprot:scaffold821_cov100-Isochrysis_galbana.AAC.2